MSDLISRQDAIDHLKQWLEIDSYSGREIAVLKGILRAVLFDLETMLPAEKAGTWLWVECIDGEGLGANAWKCSECGEIYRSTDNYCPHCGSRNEVEDDN